LTSSETKVETGQTQNPIGDKSIRRVSAWLVRNSRSTSEQFCFGSILIEVCNSQRLIRQSNVRRVEMATVNIKKTSFNLHQFRFGLKWNHAESPARINLRNCDSFHECLIFRSDLKRTYSESCLLWIFSDSRNEFCINEAMVKTRWCCCRISLR
jgi:hypothetical protein